MVDFLYFYSNVYAINFSLRKVMMDFEDLKNKGSALGTAAVTVFDKSVDMIAAIRRCVVVIRGT